MTDSTGKNIHKMHKDKKVICTSLNYGDRHLYYTCTIFWINVATVQWQALQDNE